MKQALRLTAAALIGLSVKLAGCGGSDSSGSPNAEAGTGGNAGGTGGNAGTGGKASGTGGNGTWPTCEGVSVQQGRTACRDDSVCATPDQRCFLPGDRYPCGVPCLPQRSCESDLDCESENTPVCSEFVDGCCGLADPLSSSCGPACTADSCPGGTTCAEDGRCQPFDCQPGDCDQNMDCDPQTRRCVARVCSDDEECDCGICGRGTCLSGPGYCDWATAA